MVFSEEASVRLVCLGMMFDLLLPWLRFFSGLPVMSNWYLVVPLLILSQKGRLFFYPYGEVALFVHGLDVSWLSGATYCGFKNCIGLQWRYLVSRRCLSHGSFDPACVGDRRGRTWMSMNKTCDSINVIFLFIKFLYLFWVRMNDLKKEIYFFRKKKRFIEKQTVLFF